MLKTRHAYEIAVGRHQLIARPTEAVLQDLEAGQGLPKTPSRRTCAVDHALLLQYSSLPTNATALLLPTHHLDNRNKKKLFLHSTTDYKKNIEKFLNSLYCS